LHIEKDYMTYINKIILKGIKYSMIERDTTKSMSVHNVITHI